MRIELDVPIHRQRTTFSCWWASFSMLLRYHTGRYCQYPWEFNHVFAPPSLWGRYGNPGLLADPTTTPSATEYGREAAPLGRRGGSLPRSPPHEWYTLGIPPNAVHLGWLATICELRALPWRSSRSTRSDEWLRPMNPDGVAGELRSSGPVMVIGPRIATAQERDTYRRLRGDDVRYFHHAVVIIGVERTQGRDPMVIFNNPGGPGGLGPHGAMYIGFEGLSTARLEALHAWIAPLPGTEFAYVARSPRAEPRILADDWSSP